jgi:hypothetical protein
LDSTPNSDGAVALRCGLRFYHLLRAHWIEYIEQQQTRNEAADVSLPGNLLALFPYRDGAQTNQQIKSDPNAQKN